MKKVVILGSTGSIGRSTLDVIGRHPDRFEVVGLAVGSNVKLLAEQIGRFNPRKVSVRSTSEREKLQAQLTGWNGEILCEEAGAVEVAVTTEADIVVSSIVGAAGLVPTYESLSAGIDVALANKESLVIAGKVMTGQARANGAQLIPVDSEHSAIFQALAGNPRQAVRQIGLTASGGPFRQTPKEEFERATVEQALNHPNWSMGDKITIDSATMMNKGLELIEATWLFDCSPDQITILIHPQSIVHSMVEYIDGSVMAQLGVPDMRCAIAYALSYPDRIETGVESLNLFDIEKLTFYPPDEEKFPTLRLAQEAARQGESYPAVLNAANEVAVASFLEKKIKFSDIFELLEKTLEKHRPMTLTTIADVLAADAEGRSLAGQELLRVAA